jgi:hypothetical protein
MAIVADEGVVDRDAGLRLHLEALLLQEALALNHRDERLVGLQLLDLAVLADLAALAWRGRALLGLLVGEEVAAGASAGVAAAAGLSPSAGLAGVSPSASSRTMSSSSAQAWCGSWGRRRDGALHVQRQGLPRL